MDVFVINMIPKSLSGEQNQDSKPNLAINPANPLRASATAFTPDPLSGPPLRQFTSNGWGKDYRPLWNQAPNASALETV